MKASDFLLCPLSGNMISSPNKSSDGGFVFSDGGSDTETFEDSNEALSDVDDESSENFLTPLNFKSYFGRRLSVSTTGLSISASDLSLKRNLTSPNEKKENKKSRSRRLNQNYN